jgi:hypothetical protein
MLVAEPWDGRPTDPGKQVLLSWGDDVEKLDPEFYSCVSLD